MESTTVSSLLKTNTEIEVPRNCEAAINLVNDANDNVCYVVIQKLVSHNEKMNALTMLQLLKRAYIIYNKNSSYLRMTRPNKGDKLFYPLNLHRDY